MLRIFPGTTGALAGSSIRRPVELMSSVCPPTYRPLEGSYTFTGRCCVIRNPRRRSPPAVSWLSSISFSNSLPTVIIAKLPYPRMPIPDRSVIGTVRRDFGENFSGESEERFIGRQQCDLPHVPSQCPMIKHCH